VGKTTGTLACSVSNHEERVRCPPVGPVGTLGGLGPALVGPLSDIAGVERASRNRRLLAPMGSDPRGINEHALHSRR
jgi:hypothetical protein